MIPDAPITYSSAKAALNAYIKGISRPFGKEGVRINAIAPGNIIFEGSSWSSKMTTNPQEVQTMLQNKVPLGRFGNVIEVSNLVKYLASPISAFATGAIWRIDGGQSH